MCAELGYESWTVFSMYSARIPSVLESWIVFQHYDMISYYQIQPPILDFIYTRLPYMYVYCVGTNYICLGYSIFHFIYISIFYNRCNNSFMFVR